MNISEMYVSSLDDDVVQRKDKVGDQRSLEKAGSGLGLIGHMSDVNNRRKIFSGKGRARRAKLYHTLRFV